MSGREGYESAHLIGIADALCKSGNEMHNYYRYSQLSSCEHVGNSRTAAEFPSHFRLLLANKDSNSGHDGNCTMLRQFVDKAWSFFEK